MTEHEYLELERTSDTKHEFYDGIIVDMAGASPLHNTVAMNVGWALRSALANKPCLVWQADARVHAKQTRGYFYPDHAVVCGKPELGEDNPPSLLNPLLVVEVLSPSTEQNDRGAKFSHFKRTPSLMTYVLVDPQQRSVEVYSRREKNHWDYVAIDEQDAVVPLTHPECELRMGDIFSKLDLLPPATTEM